MTFKEEKKQPCWNLFLVCNAFVLLFVFACWQDATAAGIYYVDANVPASGDGSLASPWKTLQDVNARMAEFSAGDKVLFKRGGVFSATEPDNRILRIEKVSGAEGDPITFEAYGDGSDPVPVINGSWDLNGWVYETDGVWSHAYALVDPAKHRLNILRYNGIPRPPIKTLQFDSVPSTLLPNATLLQLNGVFHTLWITSVNSAAGTVSGIAFNDMTGGDVVARQMNALGLIRNIPESPLRNPVNISTTPGNLTEPGQWFWDNGKIYLKSDTSPGGKVQVGYVGNYEDFVKYTGDTEVWYAGIDVLQSTHVVVKDFTIQGCNENGITLRNSSNITVSGMDIFACGLGGIRLRNASDNEIRENKLDSTGGIHVWAFPGPDFLSVNNAILNNTVSNCSGSCISLSTEGLPADPGEVSGNRIAGNFVRNANTMQYESAGIYTWAAGANTIESNVIKDGGGRFINSAGIMIDVSGGPMIINRNTVENNSNCGIAVTGDGHQITNNVFRNNGFPSWQKSQLKFFATANNPAQNCSVTGNIMEADQGQDQHFIFGVPGSQSGHFIDYNTYVSRSERLFNWHDEWEWMDFLKWQQTTGHDSHSTLTMPLKDGSVMFLFMPAIIRKSVAK